MPVQSPQWMDVLCCCICYNAFDGAKHEPVSLVCCHTACRACLLKLKTQQCPFDQCAINIPVGDLPQNSRILKILDVSVPENEKVGRLFEKDDGHLYLEAVSILESLCVYLKRAPSDKGGTIWSPQLSRPMQRKLTNLLCCNLVEPDGRSRALKSARSLGERCLTELLLLHQNPHHLSSNLWATVRARGCQFLGPAMQEEVLRLVLLALSEGASISRKVLVMYIVQTLEKEYPQASKTSVGHVVQLLYRASCFNVIKRDSESSLMQLKEEFRVYDSLRREHDAQIVQIAMEAGLRISPDQWSALLYGDQAHKSHMQSIIDRLQSPQSFNQCIQELLISLQRTGDPGRLVDLRVNFETLAEVDIVFGENAPPLWPYFLKILRCVKVAVDGQVNFCENYGCCRNQREASDRTVVAYKFKTSLCRDIGDGKACLRGDQCTFAHSLEEMERYRARSRLIGYRSSNGNGPSEMNSGIVNCMDGQAAGQFFQTSINENSDMTNIVRTPLSDFWTTAAPHYSLQPAQTMFMSPGNMLNNCSIPPPPLPSIAPAGTIEQHVVSNHLAQAIVSPVAAVLPSVPPTLVTAATGAVPLQPPAFPLAAPVAAPAVCQTLHFQLLSPAVAPVVAPAAAVVAPPLSSPVGVTSAPSSGLTPRSTPEAPPMTQPAEFGYFWTDASGDLLSFELPVAHVMHFPQQTVQTYSEFYPPAPQRLTPVYRHAQQLNFDTVEAYYTFPPAGVPLYYEEVAPQAGRPVRHAQFDMNQNISRADEKFQNRKANMAGSSKDRTNGRRNLHENGGAVALDDKTDIQQETASELHSLGRRRDDILCRLSALKVNPSHSSAGVGKCDEPLESEEEDLNTKRFVHRVATSVLPEDFSAEHQRLKWTSSGGPEILAARRRVVDGGCCGNSPPTAATTMLASSMRVSSSSSRPSPGFTPSASFKEEQSTFSAPIWVRGPARRSSSLHRSLSSDDEDAKKFVDDDASVKLAVDSFSSWSLNNVRTFSPSSTFVGAASANADEFSWRHSSSFADFTKATFHEFADAGDFSTSKFCNGDHSTKNGAANSANCGDFLTPQAIDNCLRQSTTCADNHCLTNGGKRLTPSTESSNEPSAVKIDIRRLSYGTLRRELEKLPANHKRARCIRFELESREPESWRSEEDPFVPFSGVPQVSRYGPISRSKAVGLAVESPLATNSTSCTTSGLEVGLHVTDVFTHPLTTAVVQPIKDQPMASRDSVDPFVIVGSIPIIFQAPVTAASSDTVTQKLDKFVEINEKLDKSPAVDSLVERKQMKMDLQIIQNEISSMNTQIEEKSLRQELQTVNLDIEKLQK